MIDRKAFQISGLIFLAIIAATLWRLSLFPDWQASRLGLFGAPASLLFMLLVPLINWLGSTEENLPSWRRWSGKWLVSWSVFIALLQVLVLARSLGLISPSGMETARGMMVWIGIMFMMLGNAAPKTPIPSPRNSPPGLVWQQNRLLRFIGKLLFGVGLAFALGGVLLPLEYWRSLFLCLTLAAFAAAIWYRVKLRREPSPLP